MTAESSTCPLTRRQVTDQYFIEHRAKMIDIAAFFDRVDRAQPDRQSDVQADGEQQDYRLRAFAQALAILTDGQGQRARRILNVLSDPTADPIAKSPGKGASGACPDAIRG